MPKYIIKIGKKRIYSVRHALEYLLLMKYGLESMRQTTKENIV